MAMNYNTLVADKATPGSIANWVNYSRLPPDTILEEAQALIYGLLRTREMLVNTSFSIPIAGANTPLPARFLDPIGRIVVSSINTTIRHKDSNFVELARNYTETSGTLGTDPFTTTAGSASVSVSLANHGFSQDSVFNTSGATAFDNVTINGTFPVTAITDANDFVIDISSLGALPQAGATGGGTAVDYLCDNLVQGIPAWWGIWNETIYFDVAFTEQCLCKLQYYQSLPLLSASNPTNFLTNRYPQLVRVATNAAAADFMKDSEEYNEDFSRLSGLIQTINIENDGSLRGLELDPFIP